LYELLDKLNLHWMDRVICVSKGQAVKVRSVGISTQQIVIIHNAIQINRFKYPNSLYRQYLQGMFDKPVKHIVIAAGRLSPEKGFEVLVDVARQVIKSDSSIGFVLFGDGCQQRLLHKKIAKYRLSNKFVLAGFHDDLDRFMPFADL